LIQPDKPAIASNRAPKLPSIQHWTEMKTPREASAVAPGLPSPADAGQRFASAPVPPPRFQAPTTPSLISPWDVVRGGDSLLGNEVKNGGEKGTAVSVVSVSKTLAHDQEVVAVPPVNQPVIPQEHPAPRPGTAAIGKPAAGADSHTEAAQSAGGKKDAAGTKQAAGAQETGAPTTGKYPAVSQSSAAQALAAQPASKDSSMHGSTAASNAKRLVRTPYGVAEVLQLPAGTQQWDFPAGGAFDVVIVQQTAGDSIPGAEELLIGTPVQTVYIWNESPRHWIMQYCVPPSESDTTGQSGMVVSLGAEPKLGAPFVRRYVIPPAELITFDRGVLFRGTLGADGRFENLQAVRSASYQPRSELIPYLNRWLFRPATLDEKPAKVDVLLYIPGVKGE
jgi:hypothetical protein